MPKYEFNCVFGAYVTIEADSPEEAHELLTNRNTKEIYSQASYTHLDEVYLEKIDGKDFGEDK